MENANVNQELLRKIEEIVTKVPADIWQSLFADIELTNIREDNVIIKNGAYQVNVGDGVSYAFKFFDEDSPFIQTEYSEMNAQQSDLESETNRGMRQRVLTPNGDGKWELVEYHSYLLMNDMIGKGQEFIHCDVSYFQKNKNNEEYDLTSFMKIEYDTIVHEGQTDDICEQRLYDKPLTEVRHYFAEYQDGKVISQGAIYNADSKIESTAKYQK